jgi:hypothetical protein
MPGGPAARRPGAGGTHDGRDTGAADAGSGSAILVCPPPQKTADGLWTDREDAQLSSWAVAHRGAPQPIRRRHYP